MTDFFSPLFAMAGLSPDGSGAYPAWLHASFDALIALVYGLTAGCLFLLSRRQLELAPYANLLRTSALLAIFCGIPYLLGVPGYWYPNGWLALSLRVLVGLSAMGAVAVAGRLLFGLLFPSPEKNTFSDVGQELSTLLERHKQTEDELRKLSLAVEHSSSMVLIIDTQGRVEYCNPAFCKITGYTEKEVRGRRASVLMAKETDQHVSVELWNTLNRGETWEGELLERKKNGDLFWCLKYFAPIRNDDGKTTHFVAVSHDITEVKNSEETIRRLAYYDPLTSLPNRTLFKQRLEQIFLAAGRDGTSFAVMYLDLDRFKDINDSLGHDYGDQLLVAVAQRLRECVGDKDVIARLGGDEFAIIMPELRHQKIAGAAAATIQQALSRPFALGGHDLFVTASLGISLYPNDHSDVDHLIKMADSAMYNAKDMGRNQFQYYNELPKIVPVEQLSLQNDLRFALERNELQVYYQPKFEMDSEQCHSVEALLRWRHPSRGMVSPGRFIPIAEQTGLIGPIGEWLLRAVSAQIKKWKSEGIDLSVAINLSAQQFRQKNLLSRIDAILEETGVDRTRLEFEITESAVMGNPEQTAEIMRSLKQRGVSLAIDDFGTGYSSLSYLRMFPVDILKIDQSFVRDIGTPSGDTRIVRAIAALAHSLELTVVAEGVETRAQLEFLRQLNCDLIQGYYYSPPLPANDLIDRLNAIKKGGVGKQVAMG
ncbi:putative bifunctional diguanylate cyclase/phosphodiesterase [Methylomagnum sp.]